MLLLLIKSFMLTALYGDEVILTYAGKIFIYLYLFLKTTLEKIHLAWKIITIIFATV